MKHRSTKATWWVLASCAAGSWVVACGDGFTGSCRDTLTCPVEGDGEEGGAASSTGGDSAASAAAGAGGHGDGQDGGAGGADTVDPIAGAGGGAVAGSPLCEQGYEPWLTSGFSFPNGTILGTGDFPSQPWISSGGLEIDAGRLTGLGMASLGQGGTFPYGGLRLRFRARFSDSGQSVAMAFNGAKNDVIGVYVTLDSSGKLSLAEGSEVVAEEELAPLDTGLDWFVETEFVGAAAEVTVARVNYGSQPQSDVVATLNVGGLKASASGVKTLVELAGNGALSPAVDELSIARCGIEAPQYQTLFLDAFERANSTSLGSADFPQNAAWTGSSNDARILDGALAIDDLAQGTVPLATVPGEGLRLRTTIHSTGDFFWADVNYNGTAGYGVSHSTEPGFMLWSDGNTASSSRVFLGNAAETKHAKPLEIGAAYFVELNRDDGTAVLTVRTGSFTGPLLLVDIGSGLTAAQNTGSFVRLSAASNVSTTHYEDFRIERYVAE